MNSQLAREIAALPKGTTSAREIMETIENSTASPMEKSHARSILMESNSRLQGNPNTLRISLLLEEKVEFWLDMRRERTFTQAPRWRR